jgi:PhzF family phenazine biosynthesis protein
MTKIYVASAFCKDKKGGNKAGVVFDDNKLSDDIKKYIAKQLGYAETAFISKSNKADYCIRYFTPAEEVPLCGHATVASFGILKYLKMLDKEEYTIETQSGILSILVKNGEIMMEQNIPTFYEEIPLQEIKECFDIDCINKDIPIQIVSTGLKDILVPIKNINLLEKLKPNFDIIKSISKKYNVVGTHLYTLDNERIVCRNFAPIYEVDEESATGTSNCALAGFLYKKLDMKKNEYIMEQGYSLNLPSIIKVNIITDQSDNIVKIYVGGKSEFLFVKEL